MMTINSYNCDGKIGRLTNNSMIRNKRGQYSWIGILICIFLFAAVSVFCLFLISFLTGHKDTATTAATISVQRGLANDIVGFADLGVSNVKFWSLINNQSVSSVADQNVIGNVSAKLILMKANCALVMSKSYADGVETQLLSMGSGKCTSAFVVALPKTYALIDLGVPQ